MSANTLPRRRPEILLALLLSLCLVILSLQVRRPSGRTAGETALLAAASPLVGAATEARDIVSDAADWTSSRETLLRENRELKERIQKVSAELLTLRDSERDRARLELLLGTMPDPPEGTRVARLIALESAGAFRTALLDRGRGDGIRAGAAVVAPSGVIGRVVSVAPGASRVQLLSDRMAAAGVLFTRGERTAVVRGDGTGGVGVQYVPRTSDVAAGDELVTSGTDGVYPKNLAVGRVAEVRRGGDSLFLELPVTLAADPVRESVVFVLPPVKQLPPASIPVNAAPPPSRPPVAP